ncbi:MAG: hypothetical protein JSV23_01525 [Promethearchaeota archaeon]|nr:MAG: hypothetical protein JSV23_01525 [Candidatus Lokiarchaeota archaeon]
MVEVSIEDVYKIDKDKLLRYYDRIQNQFKSSGPIQIITKFLINQSIGSNYSDVYDVLIYFRDKLKEGKKILDFAFEWIRAQKIRLEYKKYLIRAQYPFDNLLLAVDDCIFKFFLEYDTFIRKLLKKDIQEHNFSALYEIFFSPYESKNLNIQDILERHIDNIPTQFQGLEKINTNIIVLRSGLSNIIVKDYENVLFARKEEKSKKEIKLKKESTFELEQESKFKGFLIERMIKTHCISKKEISDNEIENAVSQFLSSYFKFGTLYKFDGFKDLLIHNLADDIYSGLTEKLKQANSLDNIKYLVLNVITIFSKTIKSKMLDGMAWKSDLIPFLKEFIIKFINNL